MPMQLSQRVLRESESATMAVARRASELRAQGVELVDLGAGEPFVDSPQRAVEAAVAALRSGHTRYTAIDGLADLRLGVAEQYQGFHAPWTGREDTLITVGAKAALVQAALALVDPGSEVVLAKPCWRTLASQVALAGGHPVLVAMDPTLGFALRAQPLVDAMTEKTRAVVLNSPCNPTGAVMSADQLRLLVVECERRGIVLVSDETYGAFDYSFLEEETEGESVAGVRAPSVAELAGEFPDTVLLVSSFSKAFAMTGWRVGFALGPVALIKAMRSVQSHTTSNATSFAMHGALAALRFEGAFQREHLLACAANRALVTGALAGCESIHYAPPQGAFYAFPKINLGGVATCSTSAEFARCLLEEHRVVVVPGEAFGAPGHLRISFAARSQTLLDGLGRIVTALQ